MLTDDVPTPTKCDKFSTDPKIKAVAVPQLSVTTNNWIDAMLRKIPTKFQRSSGEKI